MNVSLPAYLYKYLSLNIQFEEMVIEDNGIQRHKNGFDALREILLSNTIYYSKPKYSNDPFEFDAVKLKLTTKDRNDVRSRTIESLIRNGSIYKDSENREIIVVCSDQDLDEIEEEHHQNQESLFHRCGFISLSKYNDTTLMWSHYADAHQGVCLRFKCVNDAFYSLNGAGKIVEVTYDDNIIENELSINSDSANVFAKISRKATCWEYEDEFRIFKHPSNYNMDDACGSHSFNSRLVEAIYLGLKIKPTHIEEIIKIIQKAGHKIDIFQAIKDKKMLKIKFIKIEIA